MSECSLISSLTIFLSPFSPHQFTVAAEPPRPPLTTTILDPISSNSPIIRPSSVDKVVPTETGMIVSRPRIARCFLPFSSILKKQINTIIIIIITCIINNYNYSEYRKTKTKVIPLTNHKGHRQSSEPIKTHSKHKVVDAKRGKTCAGEARLVFVSLVISSKRGTSCLSQSCNVIRQNQLLSITFRHSRENGSKVKENGLGQFVFRVHTQCNEEFKKMVFVVHGL